MALDIADLATRAAALGGEEAVASVSVRRELVVQAGPGGAISPPRRTFDVMVRLLVRDGAGRVGLARCSTSTSDAQLEALAVRARENASVSPIDLTPLPVVEHGTAHEGFDLLTADLDPALAVAAARAAADGIAYDLGSTRLARWRGEDVEFAVASSTGGLAQDRRTGAHLAARSIDADGRLTGFAQGSASVADQLDPLRVGSDASPVAAVLDRSGDVVVAAPGDPLVLLPAALAPLLEALARVACTGHAHATGTSPYTGRLGTEVAPPFVTLADDPGLLGGLARSIDVEGASAVATTLIAGGVEQGVVHDRVSAEEVGASSTGHAAELGGTPTGPLPRNVHLLAGDLPSIAGLGDPVVVVPFVERVATAGPGSDRFSALGRAAYVVDGGVPIRLLGDVLITGELTSVLGDLVDLTATTELVATIDRLPERTQSTTCPAAVTTGLTVLRG